MSEQSMGAEMGSPRDRAIVYLEMRQNGRFKGGREKNVQTPLVPEKVRRAGPLVDTVSAYESMIDRMGEKGYEGAKQKLGDLRPAAYDTAQAVQLGARLADVAVSAAVLFSRAPILAKGAGIWAMWRFRPIEWGVAKVAQAQSFVASSEKVAPVVNNIIHGGERVTPQPAEKPIAA